MAHTSQFSGEEAAEISIFLAERKAEKALADLQFNRDSR